MFSRGTEQLQLTIVTPGAPPSVCSADAFHLHPTTKWHLQILLQATPVLFTNGGNDQLQGEECGRAYVGLASKIYSPSSNEMIEIIIS